MQERQVTLEGRALPIAQPFMVLATQNPIEQEGTYPLPEAELDRFMLKVRMDYPRGRTGAGHGASGEPVDALATCSTCSRCARVLQARDVQALQRIASDLPVDDQVLDYAVRLARAPAPGPA
jgi:MoxR-like ATPase